MANKLLRGKSGASLPTVTSDVLTSSFTPSTHGEDQASGLSVNITAGENELALITVTGNIQSTGGDKLIAFVQLKVGATVIREIYVSTNTETTVRLPFSISKWYTFTAGNHTISVDFRYVTAGEVASLVGGNSSTTQRCELEVVQF